MPRLAALALGADPQARIRTRRPPLRSPRPLRPPHGLGRSVSPSRPLCSPRTLQRQRRAHRAPAIGSRASRYRRHPHHRPLLARFAPRHLLRQISQSPSHHRRRDHAGSSRTPPRRFRGPCRSGPSDPRPRIRFPSAFHRAPLCPAAENSQARPAPHVATPRSSPRSISFSSRPPLLPRDPLRPFQPPPPQPPLPLQNRPPYQPP